LVPADEPAKIILGDTAIAAIERRPRPRFFKKRKDQRSPHLTSCENCGAQLIGHLMAEARPLNRNFLR
jgi:hypothetical protein